MFLRKKRASKYALVVLVMLGLLVGFAVFGAFSARADEGIVVVGDARTGKYFRDGEFVAEVRREGGSWVRMDTGEVVMRSPTRPDRIYSDRKSSGPAGQQPGGKRPK